jgi:hypothetical protein
MFLINIYVISYKRERLLLADLEEVRRGVKMERFLVYSHLEYG